MKCEVVEPDERPAACCCIRNPLSQVNLEIMPSVDGSRVPEKLQLSLSGIRHPQAFKQAVYTMKHSEHPSKAAVSQHNSSACGTLLERNQMLATLMKKFPKELGDSGHFS